MATRTITIKDSHIPEMIEVFGEGYQPVISDPNDPQVAIPNPQTKAQFASDKFDEEVKRCVVEKVQSYRKRLAVESVDEVSILE